MFALVLRVHGLNTAMLSLLSFSINNVFYLSTNVVTTKCYKS